MCHLVRNTSERIHGITCLASEGRANDEKKWFGPVVPAWKVCSAFRGGEAPSWSWQLSRQPHGVEQVVKHKNKKHWKTWEIRNQKGRISQVSNFLQETVQRSWDFQPGLAQIRTAQTPGNGTAGGGPTKSKAASRHRHPWNVDTVTPQLLRSDRLEIFYGWKL